MGVNLKDIVPSQGVEFEDLEGKTYAVDALNSIYQFLASIRQHDGTPLMDSKGEVTSHLSGLLYRTLNLLKLGIWPVYVFDGKPSDLKHQTLKARGERKKQARQQWMKAKKEGRVDDALKYAKRTSKLTDEMIVESKQLLTSMGVPVVQTPSEGEAQCAKMLADGNVWAVGSQDYDTLLFGGRRLVRGLTLSAKLELNIVELERVLGDLKITREQLIDLAILVGTDFNEGVKGIGPKKALKAVREGVVGDIDVDFDFDAVREVFLNPQVSEDYRIDFGGVDGEGLRKLLCDVHEFSEERVDKAVKEVEGAYKARSQKTLECWF